MESSFQKFRESMQKAFNNALDALMQDMARMHLDMAKDSHEAKVSSYAPPHITPSSKPPHIGTPLDALRYFASQQVPVHSTMPAYKQSSQTHASTRHKPMKKAESLSYADFEELQKQTLTREHGQLVGLTDDEQALILTGRLKPNINSIISARWKTYNESS